MNNESFKKFLEVVYLADKIYRSGELGIKESIERAKKKAEV